jgi:hypothetical protein
MLGTYSNPYSHGLHRKKLTFLSLQSIIGVHNKNKSPNCCLIKSNLPQKKRDLYTKNQVDTSNRLVGMAEKSSLEQKGTVTPKIKLIRQTVWLAWLRNRS